MGRETRVHGLGSAHWLISEETTQVGGRPVQAKASRCLTAISGAINHIWSERGWRRFLKRPQLATRLKQDPLMG
eukprot:scaffold2553_cov37-Prasinocladus_malaysianus.AAC.1